MIVGDASYFVALADRQDRWHDDARRVSREVSPNLLVSDFVVAEAVTIIGDRRGAKPAKTLYEYFLDDCEVSHVDENLLRDAMTVHLHYDGRLSVSDSVNVVLMARQGIREIVSFDRGFDRVRGIHRIH